MPRTARVVVPGFPYHITQRGNYRQDIFESDTDRSHYLALIEQYSRKFDLSLYAYCLMNNHVHFIAVPQKEDSLARVFSIVHMRYSQYFNKKRKASGHLWQGRFYSCVLDEPYLVAALRYVEKNPVRAKMVKKAWQWKWSSAAVHSGKTNRAVRLEDINDLLDIKTSGWERYLDSDENEAVINQIISHTMAGRPLGARAFIEKLGEMAGKVLTVMPRGRPKKKISRK